MSRGVSAIVGCGGALLDPHQPAHDLCDVNLVLGSGHTDLCQYLIDRGAPVNAAANSELLTPLHMACQAEEGGAGGLKLSAAARVGDSMWCSGNLDVVGALRRHRNEEQRRAQTH